MSKKLKITEGQLKKLMERKHSYTDNSPEGDVEEQESNGAESAIIKLDKEEDDVNEMDMGDDSQSDDKGGMKSDIISLLQELGDYMENKADTDGDSEGYTNNVEANFNNEINDMLYRLGAGEDNSGRSAVDADFKPHEGPIEEYGNEEEEEAMNESVKAIKANFKRFL